MNKENISLEDITESGPDNKTKYRQLYEILRQRIEDRQYLPGDKMPSERELIRTTKLSLPTVRKAYDELMHDKYVARIQGRGTIVLDRELEKPLLRIGIFSPSIIYETFCRIFSFIESEFSLSYKIETQLLQAGVLLEEAYRQCDIVISGSTTISEVNEKNLAISLRNRISLERLDYLNVFAEYMRDDALRALPLTWSPLVLCCNMEILRKIDFKPPKQFMHTDLMRLVKTVDDYRRRSGENIFSFPSTMLTYYRWLPFIWQDDCDIFYSENYDKDALWQPIEFIRKLFQAESCFQCPKMVPLLNEELFVRGNFAFSFISSFYLNYLSEKAEENNFQWHLFEFPAGKHRITSISNLAFTVSTYSDLKTEAVDFYRKFISNKVQINAFKNAGFLPVAPITRAELRDSVSPKRFAEAETFFNTAIYGRTPNINSYKKINLFSQYLGMYFSKLISMNKFKTAINNEIFD